MLLACEDRIEFLDRFVRGKLAEGEGTCVHPPHVRVGPWIPRWMIFISARSRGRCLCEVPSSGFLPVIQSFLQTYKCWTHDVDVADKLMKLHNKLCFRSAAQVRSVGV